MALFGGKSRVHDSFFASSRPPPCLALVPRPWPLAHREALATLQKRQGQSKENRNGA